ncbi:unnamed protein product [Staurois parvus]|uniref:Uncharacterized protein n=1 Tax=Staurois parvus TaxID=386267 RepID=A0ABN9G4M3_9NEOB|nr:unnamed protein product [Staurois parvus]
MIGTSHRDPGQSPTGDLAWGQDSPKCWLYVIQFSLENSIYFRFIFNYVVQELA